MTAKIDPQWYKKIWSLDIQDMSWVEDTLPEVDFVVEALQLRGQERVLDLACGFGRHALELARRGYAVVGVDITAAYIDEARMKRADWRGKSIWPISSSSAPMCAMFPFATSLMWR